MTVLNAVKLLSILREQKEINQKQIAEALAVNEMSAGRMVKKLEAYNYVKRRRAEHGEWLVSLS